MMAFLQIFVTAQPAEQVDGRWIKTPEGEWIVTLAFKDTSGFPAVFVSLDKNQLQHLIEFLQRLLEEYQKHQSPEPLLKMPKLEKSLKGVTDPIVILREFGDAKS
jgi:hypothetical protein